MVKTSKKKHKYAELESLLRHYKNFKTGIKNLQQQLDFIMPGITTSYDIQEGSRGTFVIDSKTERFAIDRIESKRALDLREKISIYELIVSCIDAALDDLNDNERQFVELRYFKGKTIEDLAEIMGYAPRSVFNLRNEVLERLSISLSGVLRLW
ncbi:RinA family phage transcriptional activator [Bacillus thermophilus]|uniref:RinA family phage transcriptional activator n=1 Tax=Siminovitchia thermophila TaxID=1245522 RepID=A0ABS2RBY0_9BACI|nr:sigma factor-like helix-turn-helix DNA-binding protein [Siminovitchia thermophila]MBM7717161.1 RinA family phage transcriptional activator [Siminovitchia thermophila]